QLSATSLTVKGTELRTVRTSVEANPSHVALRNGDVVPANNRGQITFNVNLGLDQWAFHETSPLEIEVNGSQLNIDDLKNLAGVEAPVDGVLSAKVSLRGSQVNPIGIGTVTVSQLTVGDEPIPSANVDFQATGDEVRARLGLRVAGGNAQANVA